MPEESVKLFISYSHRDEALRRQLDKHLAPLQRQQVIAAWNDREIKAGMDWANQIDDNLNKADIILLLISPDFVASDYCSNIELEQAMRRHRAGESIIVPIVLEPCDWMWLPFGKFQAFPRDAKAITTWVNQNEAFLDVVAGIRKVAQELFVKRQQKLQQKRLDSDEYKAKVEEALSLSTGGSISVADRDTLDELCEKLGLTKEEAGEIEAYAYQPFKDREEKLEKYKKTLLRYVENGEYPFSEDIRRQLEIRQRDLGIKTEDIEQISQPILANAETNYQTQLQAEAVEGQRQLHLGEAHPQLAQQQQAAKAENPTREHPEETPIVNTLKNDSVKTNTTAPNPTRRTILEPTIASQAGRAESTASEESPLTAAHLTETQPVPGKPKKLVLLVSGAVAAVAVAVAAVQILPHAQPNAQSESASPASSELSSQALADVRTLIDSGVEKVNKKDFQGAIDNYTQALQIQPDSSEAYANRAAAQISLGDRQAAIADSSKAIEINRNWGNGELAYAYNNRGAALLGLGKLQEAIADLSLAIQLQPNSGDAYWNRAAAYEGLKATQSAVEDFQKAADIYNQQGKTTDYQDAIAKVKELS